MKKILLIASMMILSSVGFSAPIDPCAPTVLSKKMPVNCKEGPKSYSILIKVFQSPKECGPTHTEKAASAEIQIKDSKAHKSEKLIIENGDFKVIPTHTGVEFISLINGLDLTHCTSPGTGGFSIGN